MPSFRIKYLATSIMMQMHLRVFLPQQVFLDPSGEEARNLKVLWLLHPEGGDCTDYERLTLVEKYAEACNFALIMPNMDNSIYMDMAHGAYQYFTYMTEELPPYIRSLMLVLPKERERNYVAGVEGGGYGAVKWALAQPAFFCGCASFSGELDIRTAVCEKEADNSMSELWSAAFGWESYVTENVNDLVFQLSERKKRGEVIPKITLTNSVKDDSYERNAKAVERLKEQKIEIDYTADEAASGWDLWDKNLRDYLYSLR